MARRANDGNHQLEVPIDASGIEGFEPGNPVQVLVQGAKGALASTLVKLDNKGHGIAKFTFGAHPGSVSLILGPHDATPEQLSRLQTISVNIPVRRWGGLTTLKLPSIVISRYYWEWWPIWCRTFSICGRVLCPDGSPAVGATVCAYDVDWWWWWTSTQQIGCATTDSTGAFCMTFTWCCGWWDWWWWTSRSWRLDEGLVEQITSVMRRNPDLPALAPRTTQPSLADFSKFLGASAAHLGTAKTINSNALASLGELLRQKMPPSQELRQAHIWPWYPWEPPGNDCSPDVIFKVTQNCSPTGDPTVIVNETIWDTRWDIPTTLNVTLVANDKACCLPPSLPCGDPECLDLTDACGFTVDTIGGNIGAPPAPIVLNGLYAPNASQTYSDRPFGGNVPISGTAECTGSVDYYEFEWMTQANWQVNPAGPWNSMPPNANGAFTRQYISFIPLAFVPVTFAPQAISGRNVYETLHHFEGANPPGWGSNRLWIVNRDMLINWLTANNFNDGTYYLRLKGYDLVGSALANGRVLNMCGTQNPNYVVLTVDNRIVTGGSTDLYGNPCTSVHACTDEPATAIPYITILQAAQNGGGTIPVDACGVYQVKWPDQVQIDFVAYDPDGYLAEYGLNTYFGINLSRNLLALATTLKPYGGPWNGVPNAAQVGPTYSDARGQSAFSSPTWNGGMISLILSATDDPNNPANQGAFPITCCYQMRLDAYKRTIVNCNQLFTNTSETSFTIVVIP
jgi:hypothetical protein